MGAGPILIFDKSTLQALTVDEAVWLDQFFLPNITTIFFVETFADLDKEDPKGPSPDDVVANLAAKLPVMPYPNIFHHTVLVQDLLVDHVPLTGQIALAAGALIPDGSDGTSAYFPEAPEADSVRRWQAGQFWEIERLFARQWRAQVSGINFNSRVPRSSA